MQCMLVSSIVIEIKILLIDKILDHFVHHSIFETAFLLPVTQNLSSARPSYTCLGGSAPDSLRNSQ
jgi:hypothetical protein